MNKIFIYDSLKNEINLKKYFKNIEINHGYIQINNKKLKIFGIIVKFVMNIDNIVHDFLNINEKYKKVDKIIAYDIYNNYENECYILL
tara:strand:- start:1306 stop:1569 length:264 start_codon:yes stop_codon:yes gene_type:complete